MGSMLCHGSLHGCMGIGGVIPACVVADADAGGLQLRIFPDRFGEPFFLVRGQGVHGVEDDGLDALLPFPFVPAAVVQDRDEKALGFA